MSDEDNSARSDIEEGEAKRRKGNVFGTKRMTKDGKKCKNFEEKEENLKILLLSLK